MSLIPLVFLALISLALYGLFFKLSAALFKRTKLSWGNSFLFALLLLLVFIGVKALSLVALPYATEGVISAVVLIVGLMLGSWFFGARAKTSNGQELGWLGGLVLTSIGFALLIITGLALILLMHVLRNPN